MPEAPEGDGYQSLGAVKLKSVERGADGKMKEVAPPPDPNKTDLEGMESNVWDQMGNVPAASDVVGVAGALSVDSSGSLVGAPPLPPSPPVPELISAVPVPRGGFISTLAYGLTAQRRAQRQRERIKTMGVQLGQLKKKELELLSALGRAARLHDLCPAECSDLVEASSHEEMSSLEDRLKSDESLVARQEADRAFQEASASGEHKLAGLEAQQQNMLKQFEGAKKRLADAEAQLDDLRRREQELRTPPRSPLSDDEVTKRVQEFEDVKARRKICEMELETLNDQVRAAQRPLSKIGDEIARVRQDVTGAKAKLTAAENMARAAEVSGARRQETVSRDVAVYDEEIGRRIVGGAGRVPPLRQVISSADICRRQVSVWEQTLADQQGELERLDESRARRGFWMLVGGFVGLLILLIGAAQAMQWLTQE